MPIRPAFFTAIALLLPAAASAQPARAALSAPALGYMANPSGDTVRAILGTPAAALFSGPLMLPSGVSHVYLPPRQKYALAEQNGQLPPIVLVLSSTAAAAGAALANGIAHPDQVAFSPQGTAVALYSAAADRLQIVGGLPDAPTILADVKPLNLPDAITKLAVSDDGSRAIAVSRTGAVYSLSGQAAPSLLGAVVALAGPVFVPGSTDIVYCDLGTGIISRLGGSDDLATSRPVAHVTGLGKHISLEAQASGEVILADIDSSRIIDISNDGAEETLPLPQAPTSLIPLRSPQRFLLSAAAGKPGLVLDLSTGHPRFFYIPQIAAPVTPEAR